jgi:metallo-beta-lactamase family protein
MASRALDVYEDRADSGSPEFRPQYQHGPLFPSLRFTEVRSTEESKELNERPGPMVVVSASGMATGGRVIHHLANRVGDPDNAVLLVGFQAPGTRGDALRKGAQSLKMLGREFPVRARVASVPLSSHADRDELLAWLQTAAPGPGQLVVNHGEPQATAALVEILAGRFDCPVTAAEPGAVLALCPGHSARDSGG